MSRLALPRAALGGQVFGTVAVLITAALTGQLNLAAGLLLNEGSAVLIILNGLWLLWPHDRRAR